MNPTDLVDRTTLRDDVPEFAPGDTVKVHVRVVEGNRERIQVFQGAVIRRQGSGARETFTARKVSFGVGVESVDQLDRLEPVRRRADDHQLRLPPDQLLERAEERGVVIGDQDTDAGVVRRWVIHGGQR